MVTRRELLDDGVARRDLERWIGVGALVEIMPSVFALDAALATEPVLTRAAAHCIGAAGLVCDAITSARLHDLPDVFRVGRPSFVTIEAAPHGHVAERTDGIRLLSPAATWFGLARLLPAARFTAWTDDVMGTHVAVESAHEVIRLAADPRRAADRRAVVTLGRQRRWQRPPGSELERRVRASMRRRRITGLDGSHRIRLDDGMVVHPTVVDHERRWALEIDHVGWHGGRWPDRVRRRIDRQLDRAGWRYRRVSDVELEQDFASTMSIVADDHRAASLAA